MKFLNYIQMDRNIFRIASNSRPRNDGTVGVLNNILKTIEYQLFCFCK